MGKRAYNEKWHKYKKERGQSQNSHAHSNYQEPLVRNLTPTQPVTLTPNDNESHYTLEHTSSSLLCCVPQIIRISLFLTQVPLKSHCP